MFEVLATRIIVLHHFSTLAKVQDHSWGVEHRLCGTPSSSASSSPWQSGPTSTSLLIPHRAACHPLISPSLVNREITELPHLAQWLTSTAPQHHFNFLCVNNLKKGRCFLSYASFLIWWWCCDMPPQVRRCSGTAVACSFAHGIQKHTCDFSQPFITYSLVSEESWHADH